MCSWLLPIDIGLLYRLTTKIQNRISQLEKLIYIHTSKSIKISINSQAALNLLNPIGVIEKWNGTLKKIWSGWELATE